MEIIVHDLDGTLRDTSCGDKYIPENKTKPKNWREWQHHVNLYGVPLPTCCSYTEDVRGGKNVFIVTSSQFGAAYWLEKRDLPQPNEIIERAPDDCRHPVVYKKEWIDKHHTDVVKWVDDCKDVCDYIRNTYPHIEVVEVSTDNATEQIGSTPKKDTPNKVVIFNGPPRSGKDLAASFCCEYFNGSHASMKEPLLKLTADFLNITVEEFLEEYDERCTEEESHEWLCEWVKDIPMYDVGTEQLSKREALIHVSENVMKPSFGDDVFGKLAADNLPEGLVFFSDGGFTDEVKPLADKIGIENILIVHIKRDGYTFEGDSRDYVNIDGVHTVVVENDTLGEYLADVAREVSLHINV